MNIVTRCVVLSSLALGLTVGSAAQEPARPKPDAAETGGDQQAPKTDEPKRLKLGERLDGSLTLPDLDGKVVKAQEHMGKVTVVNFYSIQCPIQRDWDQRLAAIQKEHEQNGVVFLHIDSNVTEIGKEPPAKDAATKDGEQQPYAKVREHLQQQKLPFRVLVDHGNKVADVFEARTTPHVYVFGKDGRLVYKGLVDNDQKDRNPDSRENYLRDVLGKLLAGEEVKPFATKEQGCTIKRVPSEAGKDDERRGREGRRGGREGRGEGGKQGTGGEGGGGE